MNDPMAPSNYCFENQDELNKVFADLKKNAKRLNELSFGDAAVKIERALAQIEHHTQEDGWTRLSRAAHHLLINRVSLLPHPHVGINHGYDDRKVSLSVTFELPLGKEVDIDETTVADFVKRWDPGNAFDKPCLGCQAEPGNPCTGLNPDPALPVHAMRRFP